MQLPHSHHTLAAPLFPPRFFRPPWLPHLGHPTSASRSLPSVLHFNLQRYTAPDAYPLQGRVHHPFHIQAAPHCASVRSLPLPYLHPGGAPTAPLCPGGNCLIFVSILRPDRACSPQKNKAVSNF